MNIAKKILTIIAKYILESYRCLRDRQIFWDPENELRALAHFALDPDLPAM